MNTIDDPTVPDDLGDLLRSATNRLDVAPASLAAVHRRAQQRRRRRHGRRAGIAAAVLLVAGVAVDQVRGTGQEETVIATVPRAVEGSVPQPLLIPHTYQVDELPAGTDPSTAGGALDDVTASGAASWWTTEGIWYPTSAFVLADGRRFGIAVTNPVQPGTPTEARLDQIGNDGRTVWSRALPLPAPEGSWESIRTIRAIGAIGNELIVQRATDFIPDRDPSTEGQPQRIEQTSSYAAIDVDTGAERPLPGSGGRASAAAAGDVMVEAPGTDCTIEVTTLANADRRTLDGGCGGTVPGLAGLATQVRLTPDGRYLAATWNTISTSGPGSEVLTIVDLGTGTVLLTRPLAANGVTQGLAWTGERDLTVALRPDVDPVRWTGSGLSIRSIPWDAERGTSSPGG